MDMDEHIMKIDFLSYLGIKIDFKSNLKPVKVNSFFNSPFNLPTLDFFGNYRTNPGIFGCYSENQSI